LPAIFDAVLWRSIHSIQALWENLRRSPPEGGGSCRNWSKDCSLLTTARLPESGQKSQ